MILKLVNLENCIYNKLSLSNILVIECHNSTMFKNIIANFKPIDYNITDIQIYKDDILLDLSKNCILITDFFDFSVNSKTLINKIYKKIINDNIAYIDMATNLQSIYCDIVRQIDNLINNYNINLHMQEDIDIADFFKFVNLSIVESSNPFDRLVDFFQLNATMHLYDAIVLVNPKSYFTDDQMVELYKNALYAECVLIILDSNTKPDTLKYEKKILIDEDLFDIYIK